MRRIRMDLINGGFTYMFMNEDADGRLTFSIGNKNFGAEEVANAGYTAVVGDTEIMKVLKSNKIPYRWVVQTEVTSFRMNRDTRERLKYAAKQLKRPMGSIIDEAVSSWLKLNDY